jgi:hypothetical protein
VKLFGNGCQGCVGEVGTSEADVLALRLRGELGRSLLEEGFTPAEKVWAKTHSVAAILSQVHEAGQGAGRVRAHPVA